MIKLCTIERELEKILNDIQNIVQRLGRRGPFTASDIVEAYGGANKKSKLSFFMKKCIATLRAENKMNTAYKYEVTLRQFMANLCKENMGARLLTYKRSKTGQELKIGLEPSIVEIIKRYEKHCIDKPNLLPITTKEGISIKYSNAIKGYNDKLKIISKKLDIDPPLTSYVACHTWVSMARKKDVELSVISESMGHSSEKTTQIYLSSLDQNTLDKANKMVISTTKTRQIKAGNDL